MILLYNLSIWLFGLSVRIASLFHPKAKAFVTGRKDVFSYLDAKFKNVTKPVVWVHCASLGEFEQGRPIIESLKAEFPNCQILLTFFSPSGYEVRQNYSEAYAVSYLPLDSKTNAKRFIAAVNPVLAMFVKYEFWYHYAHQLRARNIPVLSVSSIFRKDQIFFKGMGTFYQRTLRQFDHFFVQNESSKQLLESIGIVNITVAGDTRFDRVNEIVRRSSDIEIAQRFKANQQVMVVGSCWNEDLEILAPFINENRLKFIIAPHETNESSIANVEKPLQVKSIRYSKADVANLEDYSVLIIDNIGMLSRLYRYGEYAYIGGAFGRGLHNILEAACYGVPIIFGNKNYEKFQEARDLINQGGAFAIRDYSDLREKYEMLNVAESFMLACEVTRQYVEQNLGATEKIMSYCRPILAGFAKTTGKQIRS